MDALEQVKKQAKAILPTWMVIDRLPKIFDWERDLTERDFLIGVLFASDKSCSHAVTIHGNFIYDANETVALPLCIEGLDYCSSTSNTRSEFVRFYRGNLIQYKGSKKPKLMSMMLHI